MDFLLQRFATEGAFPPSPGPPATPFPSGFALKRGTGEGEGSAGKAGEGPADQGPVPRRGMPGAVGEGGKQAEREGQEPEQRDTAAFPAWDSGLGGSAVTPGG